MKGHFVNHVNSTYIFPARSVLIIVMRHYPEVHITTDKCHESEVHKVSFICRESVTVS